MQLRDIHTLADIVSDFQKVEKRVSNHSSSQSSSSRVTPVRVEVMDATTVAVAVKRGAAVNYVTIHVLRMVMHRPDEYSNDYSNDDPIDFYEEDEADKMSATAIVVQETRCKQVHDFGKCEAFDELAILRTNVDKKNISPELQKLVFADLVIDAECLYAFTEKCEWPDDNNNDENEKNMEFDGECGVCLDGGTLHEIKEDTTTKKVVNDDWLVSICEANEASGREAKEHVKHFLETCGDRDLERQLTPMQLQHGRQFEEHGIQEGKMPTTTRVKAKVTLGWNIVYEFEFWVMDHSAGSEVVLGTDFMIPAGIRLDLFNAKASRGRNGAASEIAKH
ncbi:hypothetical protein PHMEG_00033271, partial [Phytophthora megakarya]